MTVAPRRMCGGIYYFGMFRAWAQLLFFGAARLFLMVSSQRLSGTQVARR